MGLQGSQQRYQKKPAPTPIIAPYYGLSTTAIANESLVLSLTNRGPTPGSVDATFTITAGPNMYTYFAYPAHYGIARFLDVDSSFYGGWDGAHDDPFNVLGPVIVNVTVDGKAIPFYVYRTDNQNLGLCHWVVSLDPTAG